MFAISQICMSGCGGVIACVREPGPSLGAVIEGWTDVYSNRVSSVSFFFPPATSETNHRGRRSLNPLFFHLTFFFFSSVTFSDISSSLMVKLLHPDLQQTDSDSERLERHYRSWWPSPVCCLRAIFPSDCLHRLFKVTLTVETTFMHRRNLENNPEKGISRHQTTKVNKIFHQTSVAFSFLKHF